MYNMTQIKIVYGMSGTFLKHLFIYFLLSLFLLSEYSRPFQSISTCCVPIFIFYFLYHFFFMNVLYKFIKSLLECALWRPKSTFNTKKFF
jgi:hypothetical protein